MVVTLKLKPSLDASKGRLWISRRNLTRSTDNPISSPDLLYTTTATLSYPPYALRTMSQPSALIVCLGNICRSPMGEAVLRHVAKQRGVDLAVDSAGTAAYHTGEEPDER